MTDGEYRDKALLNYIRALLDEPEDFSEEEIIGMLLENKMGVEFVTSDVEIRLNRIISEKLSNNLQ